MFRTTRIRFAGWLRMFSKQRRLLLPLFLLMAGFVCGCILFCNYGQTESGFLERILTMTPPQEGVYGMLSTLYNSCFLPILLLGTVFFCGLSACGTPFILLVPFFFGLGLGMTESYYYSTGWHGVWLAAAVVLPPALVKITALLLGVVEGIRMSTHIGNMLMQKNMVGGLYHELRLFLLRFGLFLLLVLAGGILDALLRFWIL